LSDIRIAPRAGMDLPELGGAPLTHLVAATLKKRRGTTVAGHEAFAGHAHWQPAFYGLDRVSAFAGAAPAAQAAILEQCGKDLVAEAFYIEKSGMAFAAKMLLLAESADERKLYALFAADEATHFDAVAPFYGERVEHPTVNPFLALLSAVIEEGDRQSLQLVIQVVLEGWGLTHYRKLRDDCGHPALRAVLSAILADEAAHHGSGVLLLGERPLGAHSRAVAFAVLTDFLRLVQAGPLALVGAVEHIVGPQSAAARRRFVAEVDGERHAAERLAELRALLAKVPHAAPVLEALERDGRFVPSLPSELT
jgi:hypothetical protein